MSLRAGVNGPFGSARKTQAALKSWGRVWGKTGEETELDRGQLHPASL
jgi:hypothetical protein